MDVLVVVSMVIGGLALIQPTCCPGWGIAISSILLIASGVVWWMSPITKKTQEEYNAATMAKALLLVHAYVLALCILAAFNVVSWSLTLGVASTLMLVLVGTLYLASTIPYLTRPRLPPVE